jgi:hypothetical protein
MNGLLSQFITPADRQQAAYQGLLQMAAGLMQGGAPSTNPGAGMQGLGAGLGGFSQGYQGGINSRVQQAMVGQQLAEAERKRKQQETQASAIQGMFTPPPVQMAMAGNDRAGPTMAAAAKAQAPIAQMFPGQDVNALREYATAFPEQFSKTVGERLTAKPSDGYTLGPDQVRFDANGKVIARGPEKKDEQLVKVLGADGTVKYVPRAEAVGKAAPEEASIVFGPDGKPIYARGGAQSVKGLASGLTNSSQGEVEKQLVDMTAQNVQVNRIAAQFRPEFQQIGTRAGLAWSAFKDKSNLMRLGSDERQALADFTKYRAEAGQYFADRLKAMSGGAVTPQEGERQEVYLPKPGTGVFDGDSPTEFQAKTKRMQEFMTNATARLHYVSKKGLGIRDVPLDEMPKIIRERGNELAKAFTAQKLEGDALKSAVRQQLAREFGLVSD